MCFNATAISRAWHSHLFIVCVIMFLRDFWKSLETINRRICLATLPAFVPSTVSYSKNTRWFKKCAYCDHFCWTFMWFDFENCFSCFVVIFLANYFRSLKVINRPLCFNFSICSFNSFLW